MSQTFSETGTFEPRPTSANDQAQPIPSTIGQFDQARSWSDDRRGLSLGAAALLAIGASVGTAIFVRRRQEARLDRLAWVMARTRAVGVPSLQQSAPFGGAGGALLMIALLVARSRRAHAHHSRLEELSDRLTALQNQASAQVLSDGPNPRDVLLGGAVGIALASLIGRVTSRRSA